MLTVHICGTRYILPREIQQHHPLPGDVHHRRPGAEDRVARHAGRWSVRECGTDSRRESYLGYWAGRERLLAARALAVLRRAELRALRGNGNGAERGRAHHERSVS